MGLIQKLRDLFSGKKTRKVERDQVQKFINVKAIIEKKRFSLKDVSSSGFALVNDSDFQFEMNKSYPCSLTVRNEPRLSIKVKVMRVVGNVVGCEVVEKDIFEKFINSNLKL